LQNGQHLTIIVDPNTFFTSLFNLGRAREAQLEAREARVAVFEALNLPEQEFSELASSVQNLEKALLDQNKTEEWKLDYFNSVIESISQKKYKPKTSSMKVKILKK
jgi:hypothetical protein